MDSSSIIVYNKFKLLYKISHDYAIDFNTLIKDTIGNSFNISIQFLKIYDIHICTEYTICIFENIYTLYYDNINYFLQLENDDILLLI